MKYKKALLYNIYFELFLFQSQGVPYFSNPTQDADYATDHFTSGFWKSDEAFVQRRLAGQCPFLMKKVITSG